MAPGLSFVTVCKGRLAHLKQTLPLLAAQPGTEAVVVDYGCPQGTSAWVERTLPRVKVVKVDDDSGICVARGRNLGAAAAGSPRLCFVDADVKLSEGFAAWAREHARPRHYYRVLPASEDLWGTCLCSAEDFARAGGYDEAFRGWGGEGDNYIHGFGQIGFGDHRQIRAVEDGWVFERLVFAFGDGQERPAKNLRPNHRKRTISTTEI